MQGMSARVRLFCGRNETSALIPDRTHRSSRAVARHHRGGILDDGPEV